jgi:RNA polymerase sigma factor (sigma-70 family)
MTERDPRMLGSAAEADDAVQEAWLRLNRSGTTGIDNLVAWLTTVVARVCLDLLRSRRSRGEAPLAAVPEPELDDVEGRRPEHEAILADSAGIALLVVLDTLAPAERLAFVLHDMFGVPFDEIATILGRSPTAARQLASRARRRVQSPGVDIHVDRQRQREVVEAFLAASRRGDFDGLVELLDPGALVRADHAAVAAGAVSEVHGAAAVARTFAGRAGAARLALLDGYAGAVWAPGG